MTQTAMSVSQPRRDVEFWTVSTGIVFALIGVAATAAWPIYESVSYVILVVIATAAGAVIALLATLRKWSALATSAATALAYVVLAVPLAIPDSLRSLDTVLGGFLSALISPVTAWKQLVTIQIPVGSYQATAVPALIVFLVGTMLAFVLVWRRDRAAALAAPILLLMQAFGLAFGASSVSPSLAIGPLVIPAPRESALALVALTLLVALLVWRSTWVRRQALYVARAASGVHTVSSHRPAALRRLLVACGMLVVATVVAGVALAPMTAPSGREVLRTSVEPDLRVRDAVSPLSTYRLAFSEEFHDAELFRIEVAGPAIDRLRLSALTHYDGAVFRVDDPAAEPGASTDFRRVPTTIASGAPGEVSRLTLEIGALDGMWVPLTLTARSIDFEGPRRSDLVDGFYYSDSLATGIELVEGGLAAGDRVLIEALAEPPRDLATLPALPVEQRTTDPTVPDELVEWVQAQNVGVDGASLLELIERLRARGYLSHSLTLPTGPNSWTSELTGYVFEPSRSGHDRDRIATMFASLLEREREVGAEVGSQESLLVSAAGDDEQFATAAALLARHLGYDSRVVLGFRLDSSAAVTSPAPCANGVCRGGNLTAWAEVRSPNSDWIAVDTTPQYANALSPSISTVRDPELPTEVPSQVAESRLSPEAAPADGEGGDESEVEEQLDLSWLWTIMHVVGVVMLSLALLVAPFVTIVGAKALRRRRRRRSSTPEARITGGWLEWIDTAVDHGAVVPSNATRRQSALAVVVRREGEESDHASQVLAEDADRAVFNAMPPTIDESDAFWAIVDDERRRWRAERSFWQRVRSAISLASFTRAVDAKLLVPHKTRAAVSRWRSALFATSTRTAKGGTRTSRTTRSRKR